MFTGIVCRDAPSGWRNRIGHVCRKQPCACALHWIHHCPQVSSQTHFGPNTVLLPSGCRRCGAMAKPPTHHLFSTDEGRKESHFEKQDRGAKRKFSIRLAPQKTPKPVPRANSLISGPPAPLPPPAAIADKLLNGHHLAVGIDVETHILVPHNTKTWNDGQFGFKCKVCSDSISTMRIVEVGWAIGDCRCEEPVVQSYVVRPDGFVVSNESTNVHHISHAEAIKDGIPLPCALERMVTNVLDAVDAGYRVVSHHLEFDAGIIAAELVRAELGHLSGPWARAVMGGFCTMSPDVAVWVRDMLRIHDMPYWIPMRLKDIVAGLLPNAKELLGEHHRAGSDARTHWHVYAEFIRRAESAHHGEASQT